MIDEFAKEYLHGVLRSRATHSPSTWAPLLVLHGADHRLASTDEASPYDDLVTLTILDFWHGTPDGDAAALDRVTADASHPSLSTVQYEQRGRHAHLHPLTRAVSGGSAPD